MAPIHISVDPHHRPASQPMHPQPSSPTLTNPDMILPDYDDGTGQTPVPDWKQSAVAGGLGLHEFNFDGFDLANGHSRFAVGPATPPTPILYGNGTMLSDIGEVTEVESSVGGDQRLTYDDASDDGDDDFPPQVTPTMEAIRNRAKAGAFRHGRGDSIRSTDTITDEHATHLANIEDTLSVADSTFQGDDEDSVAESYTDDGVLQPRRRSNLDQSQNRYSTTTLSKRAEAILASAKRRLTNMEQHLYSARTSLETCSGFESQSPPPSALGNVHPAPSFRDGSSPSRHYRGLSEDAIPFVGRQASTHPIKRSASVLGTSATPGGYRPLLLASRSIDGGFISKPSRSPALDVNLGLLTEDTPNSPTDQSPPDSGNGNGWGSFSPSVLLSPTESSYSDRGLGRSSSSQQMRSVRDIKDHMMELRGKISSLREQARADSMRRKSIQNMRTPSPFTQATSDHGYTGDINTPELTPPLSAAGKAPWKAEENKDDGDARPRAGEKDAAIEEEHQETPSAAVPPLPATPSSEDGVFVDTLEEISEDDASDMSTEDGYDDADAMSIGAEGPELFQHHSHVPDDDAYESEGGESLYHDSVPAQLSHEDRADAFDYEHFFLHSALGSFSQEPLGPRCRSNSLGSNVSVETTRAAPAKRDSRESIDTVQSYETAQSFATANDGSSVVDEDDVYSVHNVPTDSMGSMDSTPGGLGRPTVLSMQRPATVAHMYHRPSVVSIGSAGSAGSAGTTRSFPLVNNNNNSGHRSALSVGHVTQGGGRAMKNGGGILTPRSSPDNLGRVAESLLYDTASVCERFAEPGNCAKMQDTLSREDQILVQRLVESLGKCVLGLGGSGRASPESRAYRRRIEMARRILQGTDSGQIQ